MQPVALTRGYGGRTPGRYWVERGTDTAARRRRRGAAARPRGADAGRARPRAQGARAIESGPHPPPSSSWTTACRTRRWPRISPSPWSTAGAASATAWSSRPGRCARRSSSSSGWPTPSSSTEPAPAIGVAEWLRHRFAGPVLRATAAGRRCGLAAGPARRGLGRHRRAAALFRDAAKRWAPSVVEPLPFATISASARADAAVSWRLRAPAPGAPRHHREGLGPPRRRDRASSPNLPQPRACCTIRLSFAEPDAERLAALIDSALKGHRERVAIANSASSRSLFALTSWSASRRAIALEGDLGAGIGLLQLHAPVAQIRQHDGLARDGAAHEVARA